MPSSDAATEPEMASRKRRWVGPAQVTVVIALVALAFVYARVPDTPAPTLEVGTAEPTPKVRVMRPHRASHVVSIETTGSVGVRNHVALTPQVTGRVVAVSPSLRAGGSFTAGGELLVVDRSDFELAVEQARADSEVARSNLLLEQAKSDAARANYAILHPGEEVPSLVARLPQIAQAEAQVEAADARLKVAALNLERTAFSLPFDGSIVESRAEVGQMLTRGQPFGQAFAYDAVEVVALVAPDELRRIEPAVGRRATVRDRYRAAKAVVERVSAELDARTRFAELHLVLEGDPPRPGTFVDVNIEGPAVDDTFLLPATTEQANGDVWIVSQSKLEAVAPRVYGRTDEGRIVQAFGIQDGIVVGVVPGARPGQTVDIRQRDPMPTETERP